MLSPDYTELGESDELCNAQRLLCKIDELYLSHLHENEKNGAVSLALLNEENTRETLTMLSLCMSIHPVALFKISCSTHSSLGKRVVSVPSTSREIFWCTRYIGNSQKRQVRATNREHREVPGMGMPVEVSLTVTCG